MEKFLFAAAQLGVLAVAFVPLERAFAARKQGVVREQSLTDLAFYAGQHLIWLTLQVWALWQISILLEPIIPSSLSAAAGSWSIWLLAPVVVISGDVLVYWYHRASHSWPILWRFHRVHHSSPRLDWLAAHREHPIDGFLTQLFQNLPALILGVSLVGLVGFITFRGLWAAFIHSNVACNIGPLRYLVGAPALHHWHHVSAERTPHNFSNLAPWLDVVFGTYHRPVARDYEIGLPERPVAPYWKWILMPGRIGTAPQAKKPTAPMKTLPVVAVAKESSN